MKCKYIKFKLHTELYNWIFFYFKQLFDNVGIPYKIRLDIPTRYTYFEFIQTYNIIILRKRWPFFLLKFRTNRLTVFYWHYKAIIHMASYYRGCFNNYRCPRMSHCEHYFLCLYLSFFSFEIRWSLTGQ